MNENPTDFTIAVCHYLFTLLFAVIGGGLAWLLCGGQTSEPAEGGACDGEKISHRTHRRRIILGWSAGSVALLLVVILGSRTSIWLGSGLMLALTWAILGLAVVGALFGRDRHRVAMFGAALFGIGYMALVYRAMPDWPNPAYAAVSRLIEDSRPWLPQYVREFPSDASTLDGANTRILEALEQRVPMPFPEGTSLDNFLKWIRTSTQDTQGRQISIFVDPYGLASAEVNLQSRLRINVERIPLRTSLDLALKQVNLTFGVKDGVLIITDEYDDHRQPYIPEFPFLTISHCVLALLAAIVGSVLAPLVAGRTALE